MNKLSRYKKIISYALVLMLSLITLPQTNVLAYDMGRVGQFQTISAGNNCTMAIKNDGSLWGWGSNNGYLGDGTKIDRLSPVKLMDDVVSVSTSGRNTQYTMAIKSDNSLWGWGSNHWAQLGDGTTVNRFSPVKIMDDVVAVAAGEYHTMAIRSDGSLWGWGSNSYGKVGDGTDKNKLSPVKVMDQVIAVSVGFNHTMAIKSDGSLWGWGQNNANQLGYKSTSFEDCKKSPFKVMENVIAVSAGYEYTMVIKSDNSLWGFGSNESFQLGDGFESSRNARTPFKILSDVVAVSACMYHTLAIKKDGSLWAWGYNSGGQFGDGTKDTKASPGKIMDQVAAAVAGANNTIFLKKDGSLWGCGNNYSGQLGDTTKTEKITPVKIMTGVALPTIIGNAVAATPTTAKVFVNGKPVSFEAYNINGSNYFKLRDLALALTESEKQFEVEWDSSHNAIQMTSGKSYTTVGGELVLNVNTVNKSATSTASKLYLNGKELSFIAYNIGGSNYFKLRDIARMIDFGVSWNGIAQTITVNTAKTYTN